MDPSETNDEIQKLRQRQHELAESLHAHGAKIRICELELSNVKADVETIMEKHATRDQVNSESAVLRVKLDHVTAKVEQIDANIGKVNWVIVLSVIAAILATVLTK